MAVSGEPEEDKQNWRKGHRKNHNVERQSPAKTNRERDAGAERRG